MNSFDFTDAQKRALDLNGGKLVLAGAGSGKSTVLVERYITLLAEPEIAPRNIIAMTFSRKAAENLRAKIQQALLDRERAFPRHAPHWRMQRERMPWAWIGTIHSICGKLLRLYPLEAGVDPEFESNAQFGDLREKADDHLRRLSYGHDPDLAALLADFAKMDSISALVVKLAENRELAEAARLANERSSEAVAWMDAILPQLAQEYQLPADELPNIDNVDHTPFITALARLYRIALPLLPDPNQAAEQLSFDDLERYALRLMESNTAAPVNVRATIRYLLVDEFQDTSTRQWRLIRALASDASGSLQPDKLFLVGDAKQSIYGFRQADVTVVHRAEREWERVAPGDGSWRVNLNDNFRTLQAVIDPLNLAFDTLLGSGGRHYLPFEARPERLQAKRKLIDGAEGKVDIVVAISDERAGMYGYLARRLKHEVESGSVKVEDEESKVVRPLKYEDIGILYRARTDLNLLETALRAEGIEYTLVGGRGFFERQEVLDLMHLLAALADPRDHLALAGVLRSPLFTLPDTTVSALFIAGSDPWQSWHAAEQGTYGVDSPLSTLTQEELEELSLAFRQWRQLVLKATHSTPTELLLHALEMNGAWSAYAVGRRGPQRIANIYQFLDQVRETVSKGYGTLRRLSTRLGQLRKEADADLDAEADIHLGAGVRLMTIHAAKGLEFPYVVNLLASTQSIKKGERKLNRGRLLVPDGPFADLASPAFGSVSTEVFADQPNLHRFMYNHFAEVEDRAEKVRLLYVASTRARDRLLLISCIKPNKQGLPDLKEGSDLSLWLDALGIELSPEGKFLPPKVDGVELLTPDPDELIEVKPVETTGLPLEDLSLPELEAEDPSVRMFVAPPPSRWNLPITAFGQWIAQGGDDDALRQLVWYASSELAQEEDSDADTSAVGEGGMLDAARRFAGLVGDLLHRMYEIHGPGCDWAQVEAAVAAETAGWQTLGLDGERGYQRLRELIENGQRMQLDRLPKDARRELSLLMRFEDLTLRGRADLAWREEGVAVVLDYKTNDLAEDEVDQVIRAHGYDHQARLYALALMKALRLPQGECRLVFLGPGVTRSFMVTAEEEVAYRAHAASLSTRWAALQVVSEPS